MSGAVVLLSSGLDSTVNFYEAIDDVGVNLALFVDYGQRAAKKEWEMAKQQADALSVAIKKLDLKFIGELGGSSLTDNSKTLATKVAIDDLEASKESAKNVWVPNRNGILLNVAAAIAESIGAKYVIPGFNLEEAQTFPDNSQNFMEAMTNSLSFSTANQVEVKCYTIAWNKPEIYKRALELEVNFDYVWSCYLAGEKMCGECESCQRFYRAKNTVEAS
jgi:7-cyano-7-deazaguanine synthase